ncbi:hypothetical protein HMF8227_01785 [Saliniradius amylolyticus]|uniref:Uncharacterized protein n=1 Tax=Saliniradius amylolyticus TaxID=2183582 RepID=A0A2S2E3N4_9ALTE|nr:hypothetical protein HMF8227_01785 [Saliniradius amylolyticus]
MGLKPSKITLLRWLKTHEHGDKQDAHRQKTINGERWSGGQHH